MEWWVSPYLLVIPIAWLSAHIIKFIVSSIRGQHLNPISQLFISGGMPSSHAATVVSVWMTVLLVDGVESGLFGLATLFALIVCYDAVKVRRSVGEQGESLRALIQDLKSDVMLPRAARGHTPLEVLAGAVLGALVGLVVFIATK